MPIDPATKTERVHHKTLDNVPVTAMLLEEAQEQRYLAANTEEIHKDKQRHSILTLNRKQIHPHKTVAAILDIPPNQKLFDRRTLENPCSVLPFCTRTPTLHI